MIDFDKQHGPELKRCLADPVLGTKFIEAYCELAIKEEIQQHGDDGDYLEVFESMVRGASSEAATIIYDCAQSPIERIFLATMVLSFLRAEPLAFRFTPPFDNAPERIKFERENHKRVMEWWSAYETDPRGSRVQTFDQWLNELEKQSGRSIPDKHRIWHETIATHFGQLKAFHFTMQAGFPEVRVNRRSARVDLLVWLPEATGPGLVVECDGYAYHGNSSSFQHDRKRDREFRRLGYEVVRYAGSEIVNRPVETSYDLWDMLCLRRDLL